MEIEGENSVPSMKFQSTCSSQLLSKFSILARLNNLAYSNLWLAVAFSLPSFPSQVLLLVEVVFQNPAQATTTDDWLLMQWLLTYKNLL